MCLGKMATVMTIRAYIHHISYCAILIYLMVERRRRNKQIFDSERKCEKQTVICFFLLVFFLSAFDKCCLTSMTSFYFNSNFPILFILKKNVCKLIKVLKVSTVF